MFFKKAISCFLSLFFLLSSFLPAFAESGQNITSPDQSGKSDVTATIETSSFDITVPLGLPLYLHADGSVSVATDAKIINNSQGPVIVKNVKLTPADNWKLASFTDNYKIKKVNSKELGFQIMNENVLVDGSVNMKAEDWPSIPGNGDLPLNYDGKVPIRSSDGITTAANLELTFDWDRLSDEIYTVNITSDENGSAYIDTEDKPITGSYHYGDTINLANASKTGYHFINYTDQNDNIINSPYTIKGPINIKANFEPNNYTVSINKEGNGTVSGSGDYTYNSTVTLKVVPDIGYKFVGWKDKENNIVSTDLNYSFNIVDNTELTAVFTKEDYTVSIINDGHGSAYIDTADKPTTGTYNYGNQITLINTPNAGYHFVNYTDSDGNVVNFPYTVTGSVTIKANFEADTYTVTANDDGNGTTTGSKDYKYGEQATLTATPNDHYHFVNWTDNTDNVISDQSVYSFTVTDNIDYTAHFDIDKFNVTLTAGTGGSITGASSGTYDYGTELSFIAVPTTGYHFVNYTDENGNVVNSPYTVTDLITIKANFEPNNYTVSITNDGHGSAYIDTTDKPVTGTYHYGDQITLINTPNTGYHFVNYTDSDGNVVNSPYTITGPVTIKANFSIDQFNVTLTSDEHGNITGAESGIYDYGTELNITAVPDTGYHFVNYTDSDGNIVSSPYTVTGPVIIKANFEINTYTVTANDDGNGTASGDKDYKYGEQATLTATPNEHYHFINWTDDTGNVISDQSVYSFTVSDNISYTAHFDMDQFNVTLTSDEHGSITGASSGTYDYGTELNITAVPDTGYHFVNYTDSDGNIVNSPYTVTEPVTIEANFEANTYTVTTDDDGNGTTSGGKDYKYGEQATLTATPNEHYHFTNWTDDADNVISDQSVYSFTVTENINYTAHFDIDQFTVTLTAGTGGSITGAESGIYDYGTELNITAVPDIGYHFINYTDQNGNVVSSPYTVTGPVIIKANFEANNYTVTADNDGNGTTTGSKYYKYEEQATLTATPNDHYHFTNWTDGDSNVISDQSVYTFTVTENINYTAHFDIDQFTVTLTAGTGGSITGAESGTYDYGTELNITAVPNSNYKFTKWSDNDTNPNKTITVTSDINLSAIFNTYQNLTRYNYKDINYDLKNNGTASVSEGTYGSPGTSGLSGDIAISNTVIDDNGLSYSVTSIGDRAFEDCDALTSVTIPDSVTLVDEDAFYNCKALRNITIPNSVTSIGENAFAHCDALTSVTMGNSVTSIGDYAFMDDSLITTITIPSSVTSVGIFVFTNWGSDQTINIEGKLNYQDTINAGWDKSWNYLCDAQINYLG